MSLYRRRLGLSLTETTKVVVPKPIVEHEVEYQSILVGVRGRAVLAPRRCARPSRLAARRRRGIHVLVTITVPTSSPIDAPLPEQEALAQQMIDSARVLGGRRVTGHWEKVRAGQAGRRIIDEARDIDARAIVMPRPRKRAGDVALRAYARDGPRGAAVPRDHRVRAGTRGRQTA